MAISSVSTLSDETQELMAASQHAYILQYISLIIIILAMVVGYYGTSIIKPAQELVGTGKSELKPVVLGNFIPKTKLQSALIYDDLFDKYSSKLNVNRADSIVTFLSNHDLIASFEINTAGCTGQINEVCLEREMQSAEKLSSFLRERNLAAGSFEIHFTEGLAENQVRISFFKDEDESGQ